MELWVPLLQASCAVNIGIPYKVINGRVPLLKTKREKSLDKMIPKVPATLDLYPSTENTSSKVEYSVSRCVEQSSCHSMLGIPDEFLMVNQERTALGRPGF